MRTLSINCRQCAFLSNLTTTPTSQPTQVFYKLLLACTPP